MHSLIYLFIYSFTYLFIDNPQIQLRIPQKTLALSHSELQTVQTESLVLYSD